MYNVDLPTTTVKFMHTREYMVQAPEHAEGMKHHFDVTGDKDSFEVVGTRREADRLYVKLAAVRPFGQIALHSCFFNKDTHETSMSSMYVNAIPCKVVGGHRIEQGDETEAETKPKKGKEEKKEENKPQV